MSVVDDSSAYITDHNTDETVDRLADPAVDHQPGEGAEREPFVAPAVETVADCLARGRARARAGTTVSQAECVDILLDCRNAAVRATVREVASDALAEIVHLNLVRSTDFVELLDLVHMALAVDAAFDHLDLTGC